MSDDTPSPFVSSALSKERAKKRGEGEAGTLTRIKLKERKYDKGMEGETKKVAIGCSRDVLISSEAKRGCIQ